MKKAPVTPTTQPTENQLGKVLDDILRQVVCCCGNYRHHGVEWMPEGSGEGYTVAISLLRQLLAGVTPTPPTDQRDDARKFLLAWRRKNLVNPDTILRLSDIQVIEVLTEFALAAPGSPTVPDESRPFVENPPDSYDPDAKCRVCESTADLSEVDFGYCVGWICGACEEENQGSAETGTPGQSKTPTNEAGGLK